MSNNRNFTPFVLDTEYALKRLCLCNILKRSYKKKYRVFVVNLIIEVHFAVKRNRRKSKLILLGEEVVWETFYWMVSSTIISDDLCKCFFDITIITSGFHGWFLSLNWWSQWLFFNASASYKAWKVKAEVSVMPFSLCVQYNKLLSSNSHESALLFIFSTSVYVNIYLVCRNNYEFSYCLYKKGAVTLLLGTFMHFFVFA